MATTCVGQPTTYKTVYLVEIPPPFGGAPALKALKATFIIKVPHLSKYPAYRVVNGITTARN
jgi:hypothetical protein